MVRAQYKLIVDDIASRIRGGHIPPGTQLPPVRALMKEYQVALATAAKVYGELQAVGLVVGETGRGTFVRDTSLPRGLGLEQQPLRDGTVDLTFNYPTLPGQAEMLRDGLRAIASAGDIDALLHSPPQGGRPHERHTVAKHLRNRGIRVPGEQVVIVNGAQQGLAIAVMSALKPGDVLAVDSLTYPGILRLAQAFRLDVQAVAQSERGLCLDALAKLCRRRPVSALYVMPTIHNPLGYVMPMEDRVRLAELAEKYDFLIIEDGAYAFLAEPAPKPVFVHAPQRTIYVCGLSKSVASGLRFGFVAAPPSMIPLLESSIRVLTWNTPSVTVALGCNWIESGVVDALEEQKRQDAQIRQRVARRVLRGCPITAHPSSYYLWLGLPDELRADLVAADLGRHGVLVTTAEPFSASINAPNALRLAIGSISIEALEVALKKVRKLVGA